VVVPAEPVEREHLDRPRADAGDAAQPPRDGVRAFGRSDRRIEVRAAGRHLVRRAAQRERTLGREAVRDQARRRKAGHRCGSRAVAQPGHRAP